MIDNIRQRFGPLALVSPFGPVSLVSLAAVIVVLQVDSTVPRVIAGVLLVCLLPGAGLAAAVFPPDKTGRVEWLIAAVALSLGLNIMGGFGLHLSPFGLFRESWAVLIGGVAIVTDVWRLSEFGGWRPKRVTLGAMRQGVLMTAAGTVTVAAVMVSVQGLQNQPRSPYTVLWGLPEAGASETQVLRLGINNAEAGDRSYRLTAQSRGIALGEWTSIRLASGEAWTGTLALPPPGPEAAPIVATLYRGGSDTMYRQILIWPSVSPQ